MVLIIDDEPAVCDVIAGFVQLTGNETECGHSFKEAREMLVSGRYDAVFLDVQLPDGNGLDLLPMIRDMPAPPEVLLPMTANPMAPMQTAMMTGARLLRLRSTGPALDAGVAAC